MNITVFPAQVWVLMPSLTPKEVTLVERSHYNESWFIANSSKSYHQDNIYPDKATAILAGWKIVKDQQIEIDKRQANLNKRKDALTKAALKG